MNSTLLHPHTSPPTTKPTKRTAKSSAILTGAIVHSCARCPLTFGTSRLLADHRRTHQPSLHCLCCQEVFTRKDSLVKHINGRCKKTPLLFDGGADQEEEGSETPSLPPSSISEHLHEEVVSLHSHPTLTLKPSSNSSKPLWDRRFIHSGQGVLLSDMMELDTDDKIPSPGPCLSCLPGTTHTPIAGVAYPINDPLTTTTVAELTTRLKASN